MRVIYSGVDTLEASFRGILHEALIDWLTTNKAIAQECDEPQAFPGFDLDFAVSASGLKPWKWVLAGEDMTFRLTDAKSLPTVSVRLSALGLAAMGWEPLYALAWSLVRQMGATLPAWALGDDELSPSLSESGISRIDLFADFQGLTPTAALMDGIVCPATYRAVHLAGATPQTFQYGKGEIVCRVYNKSAEIAVSGKGWLRQAWQHCPDYLADQDVWRIEFQLRRPFLKDTGGTEALAVFGRLPDLWATCLRWCELRVPEGSNQSRWPLHPAWSVLAALHPVASPLPRIKSVGYVESFEAVVPQMAGLLISASAAVGMTNLDSALECMSDQIREYIDGSGQTFRTSVRKRTRKKLAAK